jgi:tetratricopeptide (TPR) repeat protein
MKRFALLCLCLAVGSAAAAPADSLKTAFDRAAFLQSQGKPEEALSLLRKTAQRFPKEAEARFRLGAALSEAAGRMGQAGDFTNAMVNANEGFAQLDTATVLDPNHFQAHFYYGVMGVQVPVFFGKLDPAITHLQTAHALAQGKYTDIPAGQKATLYRFLGQAYQLKGRPTDAEAAWKLTLDFASTGPDAEAAKKGLDDIRKSKASAAPAAAPEVRDTPADAGRLKAEGKAAAAGGRWTEAVELYRRASEADTSDVEGILLYAQALGREASIGYDERVYKDQSWRTYLAFDVERVFGKAHRRFPDNPQIGLLHATMCVMMPFFVGKTDQGLAVLESLAKDGSLPDSIRAQAQYMFGFGLRKKGRGIWADYVKNHPDDPQAALVYQEYGLREHSRPASGERVQVSFHLGFMDELEPQTGLWIEDKNGKFVKTLYVSGFSGFAKEKQVVLPLYAERTRFETDGNTGASIDWGNHSYAWDLTDGAGKRVKPGEYTVKLEVSWWPSMRYETAEAAIRVGGKPSDVTVASDPLIPRMQVQYLTR